MIGEETIERLNIIALNPKIFSLANPNRVRALLGSFAMRNLKEFNHVSGRGYDFVLGHINQLDKINPQIAARLLTSFKTIKALEPLRQSKAIILLKTFKESQEHSHDVKDILSRIL